MKFAIQINEGPFTHQAADTAYQFTKAEARVASLLIQGLTIKEICDDLDVSRNTVSSHLKKLFMKTDTQRQSDFTRLLLSGLSQLKLP